MASAMASSPQDQCSDLLESPGRQDNSRLSYLSATIQSHFPKRDQAMVFDCVPDIHLSDFTCAVGDLLGNKRSIVASSTMTGDRIAIYLSSKELLEEFLSNNKHITIGEIKVPVRALVTKMQKVLFYNVSPTIPHYIIEEALESLNIKKTGPITWLRASIFQKGYEHVMSSKRQTFIKPEDASKLPQFMKIAYEGINYYIYPTTSALKCFQCHQEGHIAKFCTKAPEINTRPVIHTTQTIKPAENSSAITQQSQLIRNITKTNTDTNTHSSKAPASETEEHPTNIGNEIPTFRWPGEDDMTKTQPLKNIPENIGSKDEEPTLTAGTSIAMEDNIPPMILTQIPPEFRGKRLRSSSTGTNESQQSSKQDKKKSAVESAATAFKKPRAATSYTVEEISTLLQPASNLFQNSMHRYPLDFDNASSFIYNTYLSDDPMKIALTYTQDISGLTNMLAETHRQVKNRNLKNRINKLRKKLENSDDHGASSEDSSAREDSAESFLSC